MLPAAHWLAVTATRHAGAMAPRPGHEARGRRSLISRPHPWPSTSRHAELASAKTRDNDHKNKSSWDTAINPTQKWQELSLQTYFEMMDRYLLSNNFCTWLFAFFTPCLPLKMRKCACVNLFDENTLQVTWHKKIYCWKQHKKYIRNISRLSWYLCLNLCYKWNLIYF